MSLARPLAQQAPARPSRVPLAARLSAGAFGLLLLAVAVATGSWTLLLIGALLLIWGTWRLIGAWDLHDWRWL